MQAAPVTYKTVVLVCTNERLDGTACCADRGSLDLHKKLKETIKAIDPTVRVIRSSCLNNCKDGPTVAVMPANKWFVGVEEKDLEEIVAFVTGSRE